MNRFIQKINSALTPVKLTDKLFFTKNLRLMVKSGVPLNDALKSLAIQTSNLRFKKTLEQVASKVQKGESVSSAFAQPPKIFSDIFINMVAAGEESGKLDEVLDTLSHQMHKEHDLRSKVKGALAYPVVVLTAMLVITGGLVIFVIPKFTAIFAQSGLTLPLPTRILMAVSAFSVHYFYIIIILLVALLIFFIKFKQTILGKRILHKILLHLPILAKLIIKINLSKITRSLSSLLKTDIPVVKSFLITGGLVHNIYYQQALEDVAETLKTGASIHQCLEKYNNLFPRTVIQIVAVGEETGTLDKILAELAEFYEEDLDNTLQNLPSLLEPILILILGLTVGGIALAIMMPIFSLSQGVGG
jgi:type IV pilus assembly protein PilC